MPSIDELVKNGVNYYGSYGPGQAPEEDGNFVRNLKKTLPELRSTAGGATALVGDLTGIEGLKEYGLGVYQKNQQVVQGLTRDSDSFTNALEGDTGMGEFLSGAAGYVAGQAATAIGTGGVGGFIGSQLAKRGIRDVVARGAKSMAAKEVAGKASAQGAKVGAGTALFGQNLTAEAGSIYPEALEQAESEGRELTASDKARVVGSALTAAGVDTAMDAIMLGRVLKGGRAPGEGLGKAAMREVPAGMAREAVTEGIQTGIERFGAGKELSTADAIRDYVDSMAIGAVGGGLGGAAGVLHAQKVPESGPLSRAANTGIDEQILQLTNDPQPLVSFPDGSVGHKQDVEAYLSQFTDPEERIAKHRELMGRDPATGKRIEPEPEPEPIYANSPQAEISHLKAWTDKHDPVKLDYAQALLATPGAKGQGLMIVPHPKGRGFSVVPSRWLTLDTQAKAMALQKGDQGRLPAPDRKAPGGAIRVDSEGGAAPETYGEQVRTKQVEREQAAQAEAEAKRREELGTPVPHGTKAQPKPVKPILNPKGEPFKTVLSAKNKLKEYADSHEIAETDGGFVLQPKPVPAAELFDQAAHEAATSPNNDLREPSQAMKEAGNYKVGKAKFQGLDLSIENPQGSVRKGVDRDGKAWENTLAHHYGYIRRTEGADGDHVDAFVGSNHESPTAFVVDQVNPDDGSFDEHKIMLGFDSLKEAQAAYQANYAKGWKGGKAITPVPMDEFKAWLKDGDTKRPYAAAEADTAPAPTQPAPVQEQQSSPAEAGKSDSPAAAPAVEPPAPDTAKSPANTAEPAMGPATASSSSASSTPDQKDAVLTADVPASSKPAKSKALKERDAITPGVKTDSPETKAKPKALADRDAKIAAKKPKAAPADAVPAPAPKAIEDFGEHIAGARKDLWTGFKDNMAEELPSDYKDVTLSKYFPEPDYEGMIGEGVDIRILAAVKAMRDEIPAKPKMPHKLKRWGDQVKTLREFAADLLNGKLDVYRTIEAMRKGGLSKFADRIAMYSSLGYPLFKQAADFNITSGSYSMFNGKQYKPSIVKYELLEKGRTHAYFDTESQALDALRARLQVMPEGTANSVKLDLYRLSSGDIVIGKKVASGKYIDLKAGFTDVKAARAYLRENEAELLKELERKKEVKPERRTVNAPRVGQDYRMGEDVPPEKFAATFGFRGVQFGNYVEQKRRAQDLNNAYDALLDMADILGVPERAVSLNGSLGIAFGARGRGGVTPAAAHYEPGNVVINLTKSNGAGSLAHEWFHAVDNYFAKMRGDNQGFVTESPRVRQKYGPDRKIIADESIRPEVLQAFDGVIKAIRETDMVKRSKELDKTRSKDYWSTTIELAARAFETYISGKAAEKGHSNDYLANMVSAEEYGDGYPYPSKAEAKTINAAFDKLFSTLQTKETDKGTALYRRGLLSFGMDADELRAEVDGLARTWKNAPKITVVQSVDELPFAAPNDARGAFFRNQVWLVADNNRTAADAQFVLFHETLGHAGLRGAFGESLTKELTALAMRNEGIRQTAAKWRRDNADIRGSRGDAQWQAISIEEALADMAGAGQQINGLDKFLAAVQAALRAIGLDAVADWMEKSTDAEALAMLAKARRFIEQGDEAHVYGEQEAGVFDRSPPEIGANEDGKVRRVDLHFKDVVKRTPELQEAAQKLVNGEITGAQYDSLVNQYKPVEAYKSVPEPASDDEMAAALTDDKMPLLNSPSSTIEDGHYVGLRLDIPAYRDHGTWIVSVHEGKRDGKGGQAGKPIGYQSTAVIKSPNMGMAEKGALKIAAGAPKGTIATIGGEWVRATPGEAARRARQALDDKSWVQVGMDPERHSYFYDRATMEPVVSGDEAIQVGGLVLVKNPVYASKDDYLFSRVTPQSSRATGAAFDMLRSAGTMGDITRNLKSALQSDRKFNLWDRTIGTQYNKATKDADFNRVFTALQQQVDDTAHYAIEAERHAPGVLQRLDNLKDIGKAVTQSGTKHKKDLDAVSKALFANIEGKRGVRQKVFTDAELVKDFSLSPKQIEMYRQIRLAVDTSIDRLAQTTIAAMGEAVGMDISGLKNLDLAATATAVKEGTDNGVVGKNVSGTKPAKDAELHERIDELVLHANELKASGYMPAMRFGEYAVTVSDPKKKGDPLHFEMFESQIAANIAANRLAKEFPGMKVDKSILNPDAFAMFKGVSPETVELFAKFSGMDESQAYQDYIAMAKSGRSTMKRMLERKGIAGFSEDANRVLAQFITSNARQAALNMNGGEVNAAMASEKLAKKGDVQREAQKLVDYMQNPREEAKAIRGFMFMHFIGGSVASAITNLTQPVLQTAPYLSQFTDRTSAIMGAAAKMAAGGSIGNKTLAAAMERAKADGLTDPHEIHNLMADASGSTLGTGLRARALTKAWGSFFSLAESFNRRVTFLAAYQVAMDMGPAKLAEKGFKDAYEFSTRAIIETQGLYCVDTDTEILTAAGWKRYDALRTGEAVFAVNDKGALVNDVIKGVHVFPGYHELTEFRNKNGLSIMVTDDHTNIIQNYSSRDKKWQGVRKVKTKDLKGCNFFLRTPLADATDRKPIWSDDQVRLLAWVAAEGHFFAHRNVTEKRGVAITQSVSHNPEYAGEIEALLTRLGGHFNRKFCSGVARRDEIIQWQLRKPLWSFIHEALPKKLVDMNLLSKLTVPQMKLFLDVFGKGDGTMIKEGGVAIGQKSVETLNTLQAMAVLTGHASTMWERQKNTATGEWRDYGTVYVAVNGKRAYVKEFDRTRLTVDTVWCPETESGTWIARRNGRTFITGNSKANRPNWARGPIGATLFTFKQFSISYVEFLNRLPARQKMLALGILVMAAGIQGLPFADDLEDIIDTIGQSMGYNTNSKRALREAAVAALGDAAGGILTHGLSSISGIDMHGRLGMGNLIPGSGMFKPSETDKSRDALEFAGPLGSVVKSFQEAFAKVQSGNITGKTGALASIAPVALKNALKGAEMASTGQYTDTRGRKVMEVDAVDAGIKAMGFQPNEVAKESRKVSDLYQDVAMVKKVKSDIQEQWARGIIDNDPDAVKAAQEARNDWNEKNPEGKITVNMASVTARVRAMRTSRQERFTKAAPKEMRTQILKELQD